jgi:hypothetical protein
MNSHTIHSSSAGLATDTYTMSPVVTAVVTGPTDLDVKIHKEPSLAQIDVGISMSIRDVVGGAYPLVTIVAFQARHNEDHQADDFTREPRVSMGSSLCELWSNAGGFGRRPDRVGTCVGIQTDHMLLIPHDPITGWGTPEIKPYGPLSIDPASACLQYAPS